MSLMAAAGAFMMRGKNGINEAQILGGRSRNAWRRTLKPGQIKSAAAENNRAHKKLKSQKQREKTSKRQGPFYDPCHTQ